MKISEIVERLLAEKKKRGDIEVHFPVRRNGGWELLPITRISYTDAPTKGEQELFLDNPDYDDSWDDE